jgi:hypothetical protein
MNTEPLPLYNAAGITSDDVSDKSAAQWWESVVGAQTPAEFMEMSASASPFYALVEYFDVGAEGVTFYSSATLTDLASKLAGFIRLHWGQWESLEASARAAGLPQSGREDVIFIRHRGALVTMWLECSDSAVSVCEGDQSNEIPVSVRTLRELRLLLEGWWPPSRTTRPAHWPAPKLGEVAP